MIPRAAVLSRFFLTLSVGTTALIGNAWASQEPQRTVIPDAPVLKLDKLLQAPRNASTEWAKLKGKIVVFEFWATWCRPCVEQIAHLNEMASELANQSIVFISITDDEEGRLNEFLKGTHMKTWIGLDSSRANWQRSRIHSIPTTDIVNADGKLLANTRPSDLTTQKLRDLLGGQVVTLPGNAGFNRSWDQEELIGKME